MDASVILTYVAAVAIAVLTFFFAWLLWVIIAMLRDARAMLADVRSTLDRVKGSIESVEQLLRSLTERIAASGALVSILTRAASRVVKTVQRRRKRNSTPANTPS